MESKFKVVGYTKKNLLQKMDFSVLMLILIVGNSLRLCISSNLFFVIVSIVLLFKRMIEQDKMQRKKVQ